MCIVFRVFLQLPLLSGGLARCALVFVWLEWGRESGLVFAVDYKEKKKTFVSVFFIFFIFYFFIFIFYFFFFPEIQIFAIFVILFYYFYFIFHVFSARD